MAKNELNLSEKSILILELQYSIRKHKSQHLGMRFVLAYTKNSTPIYMSVEKMAKNPNFNRNYFKGVQLKVGGGAFSF